MDKEEQMQEELKAWEAMTEEEACHIYNVDNKEEARPYIMDYWMYLA